MSLEQMLALTIFIIMFVMITIGRWHRAWLALIGAALTSVLIFRLDLAGINDSVQWQTIIFVFGMMVMVDGLAESGFFRWICLYVAKMVRYNVALLFVAFFLLSGFLSMFIDSITVLLFLSSVTIEIARVFKINPIPFIISEISAANIGGSATMSGDPPNIIIGNSFDLGFWDFFSNVGVIAWFVMLVGLGLFFLVYRRHLRCTAESARARQNCPQPATAIKNQKLFWTQSVIFLLVVGLLVTHQMTHLSVAQIAAIAAGLTVISCTINARGVKSINGLINRIDWKTLCFFFGLFITVGGLKKSGVLNVVADQIIVFAQGNESTVMSVILWMSAGVSAIVDNIPLATAMVPIIGSIADQGGFNRSTLCWALVLGADIGGNATPIGASANVVGTGIAEKEGYKISWGQYCKVAVPGTILLIFVCQLLLMIKY